MARLSSNIQATVYYQGALGQQRGGNGGEREREIFYSPRRNKFAVQTLKMSRAFLRSRILTKMCGCPVAGESTSSQNYGNNGDGNSRLSLKTSWC